MNLQEWLDSRNGSYVNVDGSYGAQCWDSWSDYAVNVIGVDYWRTGTQAGGGDPNHPGYASGIWIGFDGSGLNQWFTPYGPDQPAQRGDVAIWAYGSPVGPQSHVAVVVADAGGSVYCMTQNPTPNTYAYLSKAGLLGYLRPDNQSLVSGGGSSSSPSAPAVAGGDYVVVSGDTLSGIASRVGLSWQELYANNAGVIGADPGKIYPGQVLHVPGVGEVPAPAPEPSAPAGGQTYTVVSGDTLWGISEKYYGNGAEYTRIFEANRDQITDPGLIYPGQTFVIP